MIHIHFHMDKAKYRKTYTSAMILYYTKIYCITLLIGIAVLYLIGKISKSDMLIQSTATMWITFIPVILVCSFVSIGIALYDVRKTAKKFPHLVNGEMKFRFEKTFMLMQINGKNEKISYAPYRFYRGLGSGFVLYQPRTGSIVIPEGLVSKEDRKKIKHFIKDI